MPTTRLLAIGDVHLGRQSSRLPPQLADRLGAEALGPATALRRAVDVAIAEQVSAVLLAGDIADSTRDQYHALGVLTDILRPLNEAGIEVLAVAGNHDYEVLPRLAEAVDGLHVLGRGGVWETRTICGPGGTIRVLGWSFPAQHHVQSPALNLTRLPDGPPVIGLLHADLDAAVSRYAPVRRHELDAAGPCRWLLGHVHAPSLDPVRAEPGYLGSLVGLDPTETGPRGPWLVEIEGPHTTLRHVPLAPLRWDTLMVRVDDLSSAQDELPALVADAMHAYADDRAPELVMVMAVGLRLRLSGRVAEHSDLCAAVDELLAARPVLTIAPDLWGFVDDVANEARPARDLAALARRDDPPGLLAREFLSLQEAGCAGDLMRLAMLAVNQVDRQGNFRALTRTRPMGSAADDESETALVDALFQGGYQILDDLLSGPEGADGTA